MIGLGLNGMTGFATLPSQTWVLKHSNTGRGNYPLLPLLIVQPTYAQKTKTPGTSDWVPGVSKLTKL
jgi:hypothetical protein